LASFKSTETEVIGRERPVRVDDASKVADDVGVESNVTTGSTKQVRGELAAGRNELLEDNGLGFDFANLFGDDPSGHFL